MKINWFGRTYYGNKLQYKRPVRYALRMFLKHDIWDKLLGNHYHRDENGHWSILVNRVKCQNKCYDKTSSTNI